jgi:MFS family permease
MRERQSGRHKRFTKLRSALSPARCVRHARRRAGFGNGRRTGESVTIESQESEPAQLAARTADESAVSGDWTGASIGALALLTLISTFNYFDRSVLSLVLQLIKKEMHLSDTVLGGLSSVVAIYAIIGVPVAMLADRWNRRNVVAIGCIFWSAMTFLTGFAANAWQLASARFLMACGESCGVAPSQSMLSDIFSRERLPVAIAIFTCASSLGLIFYSPAAGWIAQHYGWRMTFIVSGIPGAIVGLLFLLTVREPRRHQKTDHARIGETLRFLAASPTFWCMVMGAAFMGAYIYGVSAWGAVFLMRVHHLSVQTVGTIISPARGVASAVGLLIGGALASALARRHEGWRCWSAGLWCFLLAPCEALFVFSDVNAVWIPAMLGSSFFSVMNQPAVYSALIAIARPRMRATAISFNLLGATVVGQLVGPVLIGALNDALQARFGELAVRYSMLVAISCCVIGGACFFAGGFFITRDIERVGGAAAGALADAARRA